MPMIHKEKKPSVSAALVSPKSPQQSPTRSALQGKSHAQQQVMLKPEKKDTTVMQDIALAQDPNRRERAILEKDPDAASAWVQAASWAMGISATYGMTRPDSDASGYGGRADALRHFLWNAYMAFMVGPEKAKALGDAHESEEKPASNNMAVDREMDLRNNARGRSLGAWHRQQGAITRAFALSLMAAAGISFVNDGSLWVLDKSKDDWKLVPSNTKGIS